MFIPPKLQKLLKIRAIRYGVVAGTSTVVDAVSYAFFFHFLFDKNHLISFCLGYGLGTMTNFTLSRLFVFAESDLSVSTQGFRFAVVAGLVFLLNYLLTGFLLTVFPPIWLNANNLQPFVARFTSAATVSVVSFLAHKYFSFQLKST
jgi:putative flippase GtrA